MKRFLGEGTISVPVDRVLPQPFSVDVGVPQGTNHFPPIQLLRATSNSNPLYSFTDEAIFPSLYYSPSQYKHPSGFHYSLRISRFDLGRNDVWDNNNHVYFNPSKTDLLSVSLKNLPYSPQLMSDSTSSAE